jgi:transcriptional regulator with XRE-family HTH domain
MEFSERVKKAREHAGLNQAELAKATGLTQQMVSRIESGTVKGSTAVNRIAMTCKVNPFWLSDGIGEMADKVQTFSPQTLAIAEMVESMDDDGKRAVQEDVEKEKLWRETRKGSADPERRAG